MEMTCIIKPDMKRRPPHGRAKEMRHPLYLLFVNLISHVDVREGGREGGTKDSGAREKRGREQGAGRVRERNGKSLYKGKNAQLRRQEKGKERRHRVLTNSARCVPRSKRRKGRRRGWARLSLECNCRLRDPLGQPLVFGRLRYLKV